MIEVVSEEFMNNKKWIRKSETFSHGKCIISKFSLRRLRMKNVVLKIVHRIPREEFCVLSGLKLDSQNERIKKKLLLIGGIARKRIIIQYIRSQYQ